MSFSFAVLQTWSAGGGAPIYKPDLTGSSQEGSDAIVGLSLHSESLQHLFGIICLQARKKAEALRCKGSLLEKASR